MSPSWKPSFGACAASKSIVSTASLLPIPPETPVQGNVPFHCIHTNLPYLSALLKLDDLPPICKDVSEGLLPMNRDFMESDAFSNSNV